MNSSPEQQKRMEQRIVAINKANRVRTERARIKRILHDAPNRKHALSLLANYVENPPEMLENVTLYALLKSCHRVGPPTARIMLRKLDVSTDCRLSSLSSGRRARVVESLRNA